MRYYCRTDIGKTRENNEDYCFADTEKGCFIVADGVGGNNGGEVASQTATEKVYSSILSGISEAKEDEEIIGDHKIISILNDAVRQANELVYEMSLEDPSLRGMGTTLTMVILKEEKAFFAHIGDSRAYSVKQGEIKQITTDHSFVNELLKMGTISVEDAHGHPKRNLITRALGVEKNVRADIIEYLLEDGELILLCTDGLSDLVRNDEILGIINNSENPAQAGDALIEKALEYGGKDNITVLIFEYIKGQGKESNSAEGGVDING